MAQITVFTELSNITDNNYCQLINITDNIDAFVMDLVNFDSKVC